MDVISNLIKTNMRTGTTGYMGRKVKVLAVDRNEQYWLPDLEHMLSRGYQITRVEKVNQGLFKGEGIIFILEHPQYKFGDQCD